MNLAPLQLDLARRIRQQGPISFALFMELALYWPHGGYYAQPRSPGQDFFTAPAAHPAFGALITLQIEEMWLAMGSPPIFVVAEPGAGWGHLAHDIPAYAKALAPAFAAALRYIALDRAPQPSGRISPLAAWVKASGLPLRGLTGCILSNELFDALPVHRVVQRDGKLQEIFVTLDHGQFTGEEGDPSTPALAQRLAAEGIALVEGQRAEVCLALEMWLADAAQALEHGFILTFDYGYPAQQLYAPARMGGALRCYYQHTVSASPYDYPGGQDITAHVDFTALQAIGQRHGLVSYPLTSQGRFLRNLGLGEFHRRLVGAGLPQSQRDANRMAMLEVVRPGGMGDFKVLVQRKGIPEVSLTGLAGLSLAWKERLAALPLPLLGDHHLAILAARYPHAAQSYDSLWS
ncbi:MAG: SAM-dependent methyltransferase [Chloroflexi bacterium]|nr:SAM-dependent methyltransferase [Chloroflexota bacterium]